MSPVFFRVFLSRRGLPLIDGKRDDDLFLLLDSDELPLRNVLVSTLYNFLRPQFMNVRNKLECLSLTGLSGTV